MKWLVFPLLLGALNLHAQRLFWEEKELNPSSTPQELNAFISHFKASEIEWNPNKYSNFPCRLKNSKGNWQLFDKTTKILLFSYPKKLNKMSVEFPTPAQEEMDFTVVNYNGKKGVISFYSEFIPPVNWDEIVFENLGELDETFTKIDSLLTLPFDEENHLEAFSISPYELYGPETSLLEHLEIAGKKEGKWYRIDLRAEGPDILEFVSGVGCSDIKDIPRPTYLPLSTLDLMAQIQKEHKLDLIEAQDANAIYCYGRSVKTHQWGVFGGEGAYELIAPIYDSVAYHDNAQCFELWLEGSVYVYDTGYEDILPEKSLSDFQVIFLDYMYGVGVKDEKGWHLYDAQTGDRLVKGTAPTADALVDLWLNRFDEE